MEALKSGASSNDDPTDMVDRRNCSIINHSQHTAPSLNSPSLQGELSEPKHETKTQVSNEILCTVRSPVTVAMRQSSHVIAALENGVEAFFLCTGCGLYIYEQDAAHRVLGINRSHTRHAGAYWAQLFLRVSPLIQLKASLCSVCIMAAVGLQYTMNAFPAPRLEPSAENGWCEYITVFCKFTKHLMEVVIEADLEAMKLCASLCVCNAIRHTTAALAYTGTWSVSRTVVMCNDCFLDLGINIAFNLDHIFEYCPVRLGGVTWIRNKRVLRTLVSLRRYVDLLIFNCMIIYLTYYSWLTSTLGYIPVENPGLQAGVWTSSAPFATQLTHRPERHELGRDHPARIGQRGPN